MSEGTAGYWSSIGARLKEAREASGLTQTQLADRLGMTRSSVANFEAGRQHSDAYVLALCADLLMCDPGWLLTGRTIAPYPIRAVVRPVELLQVADELEQLIGRVRNIADRSSPRPSVDEGNTDDA